MYSFDPIPLARLALFYALVLSPSLVFAQQDDVEIEIESEPSSAPASTQASVGSAPTSAQGAEAASSPPVPTNPTVTSTIEPPPSAEARRIAELEATIARLEARLGAVESAGALAPAATSASSARTATNGGTNSGTNGTTNGAPRTAPPVGVASGDAPSSAPPPEHPHWWDVLDLRVSGFVQAQYDHSQASQNEIGADGSALNQDRFLIRRGRIRVDRYFKYAHVAVEIDANTTNGPNVSIWRAEASLFLPNKDTTLPPSVMLTGGLSEIPFGYELRQGQRQRIFMERTTGSAALFRGPQDVGARLSGAVGPFRYSAAVMNGNPVGDRSTTGVVYSSKVDVVGRVGIEHRLPERLEISGGVSFLAGHGFAPGTPATKPTVTWRDLNNDGTVGLSELTPVPGQAGTPSQTFGHWAANVDFELGVKTHIGWTRVYGEATMASNLDRTLFVANPIVQGYNVREFSWYAAFLQEITPYSVVGFRVDSYVPNADFFESRRGTLTPTSQTITTYSPVIAAQLPRRGRLVFQYDHIRDHLGRDTRGLPTDLRNDQWTVRLQGEF